MSRPEAILIAGPTASGKSALALEVAGKIGGVIINADSMQVYCDLRTVAARASADRGFCYRPIWAIFSRLRARKRARR